MSIGAVVTANRTDSAAGPRAGRADPPPQGRLGGRGPGVHRPPHRRRHPAVGLGGGVHRAHRRPPGRGRPTGRRGAVRGGGGLAQRGHRALRRVRQRQRPQRGGQPHPRRPAGVRKRPSDLHRVFHRHRSQRPSPVGRHVPPRPDPGHRRVPGRRDHRGHRRSGQAPVAVPQLAAPVGRRPGRRPHGGVLVHRRHRPQGGRGPAALAGLPRLAHRAGQPLPVQRRARARADGVDAAGDQPGRPVHRPRPVQAGQRLLRPRQWRRGPVGPGPAVQVGGARRRRGQPVLGRRVRRAVPQRP